MSSRWLILVPGLLDVVLLWPLLSSVDLVPGQYRRAYFEPRDDGAEVVFDRQSSGGYMSEIEPDGSGNIVVPAGRTIGIPLEDGVELGIRTNADDLAPYLVFGTEFARESDSNPPSSLLGEPVVLDARGQMLAGKPWDPNLPWATDRERLRELATACRLASSPTTIQLVAGQVLARLGECSGRVAVSTEPSRPPILVLVSGAHDVTVSRANRGWHTSREVDWHLIALAAARNAILSFAFGIGPTIATAATLGLAGFLARPVAIVTWYAVLLIALGVGVGRVVARRTAKAALGWVGGSALIAAEVLAILAWVKFADAGTFGKERITRAGDDRCAVVGYSTVRGDSLRYGSSGIVERLNDRCAPCMNRTSRFSREAQTLHWVRQVVCDASFPAPPAGEVVFVGGGNDDLFYQPNGLRGRLATFVQLLQIMASPAAAPGLEGTFDQVNRRVVATLDDQAADVRTITACILPGKRRFWFLHDFLVWDLDRGRTAARQATFERRRSAVREAGGEFIDLLEEFRDTAGVAWLNDFIHPSAVGQEQIARLLCDRISRAQIHAAERPPY